MRLLYLLVMRCLICAGSLVLEAGRPLTKRKMCISSFLHASKATRTSFLL